MLKTIHFMLRIALVGLSVGATAGDTETLSRQLESVPSAEMHVYRLKDSHGEGMDCLKVFQPGDERYAGVYYGVYHNLQHGVLATHLARSTDLRTGARSRYWTRMLPNPRSIPALTVRFSWPINTMNPTQSGSGSAITRIYLISA